MAGKMLLDKGGGVDKFVGLHTSAVEILGSIFTDEYGRSWRFVKNAGSTALTKKGCALRLQGQTKALGTIKRVIAPSEAGAATATVVSPAGVPMTGIGASGSATGAFGWVQCKGAVKASVYQGASAKTAGMVAPGTSADDDAWAEPTAIATSIGVVELLEPIATTGAATAVSCLVRVHCE